jgi:MFS family permease
VALAGGRRPRGHWILDGLEVTLVGSIAGALTDKDTLGLSTSQATAAGSFYLAGAVGGALLFGYLTDTFGRLGDVALAFVIGGVIMIIGGIVEIILGVEAARKPLEAVARPITAVRQRATQRRAAAPARAQ